MHAKNPCCDALIPDQLGALAEAVVSVSPICPACCTVKASGEELITPEFNLAVAVASCFFFYHQSHEVWVCGTSTDRDW